MITTAIMGNKENYKGPNKRFYDPNMRSYEWYNKTFYRGVVVVLIFFIIALLTAIGSWRGDVFSVIQVVGYSITIWLLTIPFFNERRLLKEEKERKIKNNLNKK